MNRRRFLTVAATGVACAGCLAVDAPGTDDDTHPLAGTTQTVRIDDNSDGPHDLHRNARESLEFWEENAEHYAGFSIDFEIVESEDPDIVIAYGDDPSGCENVPEFSNRVLGCAPLLRPGRTARRPITARVVASTRPYGKIRITTKHELGHVLGLDHDDEPLQIMSDQPADRIPMYQQRIDIWETTLGVTEDSSQAMSVLNHGIRLFGEAEYDGAALAFEESREQFADLAARVTGARTDSEAFEADEAVETVELDQLQALLTRLIERFELASEVAAALVESSRAAAAEQFDDSEAALDVARDRIRAFDALEPVELRDIAIALGLVRGFDLDEQIVELEEEPPADPA